MPLILYAQLLFGILFVIQMLRIFRERSAAFDQFDRESWHNFCLRVRELLFFLRAHSDFVHRTDRELCLIGLVTDAVLLEKREISCVYAPKFRCFWTAGY